MTENRKQPFTDFHLKKKKRILCQLPFVCLMLFISVHKLPSKLLAKPRPLSDIKKLQRLFLINAKSSMQKKMCM